MLSKKSVFLGLIFFMSIAVVSSQNAWADNRKWVKCSRGLTNMGLGYFEIPFDMRELAQQGERWPIATFGGLMKGLYHGTVRLFAGIYEFVTFPIPIPPGYRPLVQPESPVPLR